MKKRKQPVNISASVRDRLYGVAHRNNREFNSLVRQFFQERFLYRLSKSEFAEHFILKGAWLFIAYEISRNRPTKDIDFLGVQIEQDALKIKKIFEEIAEKEDSDGVIFLGEQINIESIKEGADYEGIRVNIPCKLGSIKSTLQIDIGYGDKIVFEPEKIEFPVILDFEAPLLRVYSLESAIAEKFQAIVSLGLASSRMKDYYDILFLATNKTFKMEELSVALISTFTKRRTDINDSRNIFQDDFKTNADLNIMWRAFTRKRKLSEDSEFPTMIDRLQQFLLPCIEKPTQGMVWNSSNFKWV